MKTLLFFLLLMFSSLLLADVNLAEREENVDYSVYFNRAQADQTQFKAGTPLSRAALFNEAKLENVTEWANLSTLDERFRYIRDLRFIKLNSFDRRSSWLFPDDGCFARASLANKNLKKADISVPNKIFVFGNLKVRTPNSSRGYVTWWYHVAPIVQVGGRKYVLDPAIDPSGALSIVEWLSSMGNPQNLKVAICSSGTYVPRSDCGRLTDGIESSAQTSQKKYLTLEWNRLISLGRNPSEELGDNPPWQ